MTTGLADEILDTVGAPMMTVSDQRMQLAVGDANIRALPCAAGVAFRRDAPWGTTPTSALPPRAHGGRREGTGPQVVRLLPTVGTIVGRTWPPVPAAARACGQPPTPRGPPAPTRENEEGECDQEHGQWPQVCAPHPSPPPCLVVRLQDRAPGGHGVIPSVREDHLCPSSRVI